MAAFGFVSVVAAAANTSIAAAVMGREPLPPQLGVYAALCAGTAFLIVGHRSVYAGQKLGLSKSRGLDLPIDVPIGEISASRVRRDMRRDGTARAVSRLSRPASGRSPRWAATRNGRW